MRPLEGIKIFVSVLVSLSLFAFLDIIGKVSLVCECGFVEEVEK